MNPMMQITLAIRILHFVSTYIMTRWGIFSIKLIGYIWHNCFQPFNPIIVSCGSFLCINLKYLLHWPAFFKTTFSVSKTKWIFVTLTIKQTRSSRRSVVRAKEQILCWKKLTKKRHSLFFFCFQWHQLPPSKLTQHLSSQIILRTSEEIRPRLDQRTCGPKVRTQGRGRRPRLLRPRLRVWRASSQRFHKDQVQEPGRPVQERLLRPKVLRKCRILRPKNALSFLL